MTAKFKKMFNSKKNNLFTIITLTTTALISIIYFYENTEPSQIAKKPQKDFAEKHAEVSQQAGVSHEVNTTGGVNADKQIVSSNLQEAVVLNGGNFESFVLKCFAGTPCTLGEDPFKMYQEFKAGQNRSANDSLIAFMRSQLKKESFRNQYKDLLKQMIDDFYPRDEKQFQEAAYYNYLGDLQKSLDTYLDLQHKAQSDPTLKPAPKLNIANTLYDMQRFKESLPYYEAALQESHSQQNKPIPSPESFIELRIYEIKNKLHLQGT